MPISSNCARKMSTEIWSQKKFFFSPSPLVCFLSKYRRNCICNIKLNSIWTCNKSLLLSGNTIFLCMLLNSFSDCLDVLFPCSLMSEAISFWAHRVATFEKNATMKTMSDHYTSIGVAKVPQNSNTRCWRGCGTPGTFISYCCDWNRCSHFGRLWQFLTQLNRDLPDDLAVRHLDIYSANLKINVHVQTCTRMFLDVTVINAKDWKQPRCPLISKWMNKL